MAEIGNVKQPSVESTKALSAASGKAAVDLVISPEFPDARAAGRWAYDRIKRATVRTELRIRHPDIYPANTEGRADEEYSYFVDLVKSDSLLSAAVAGHFMESRRITVFLDGSVVKF